MYPNHIFINVYINGDYYDSINVLIPPFIGAGISIQEKTPEGAIGMLKLRIVDVTLFSMLNGTTPVNVYCEPRE